MTDNDNSIGMEIGNVSLSVSGSEEFVKKHFYRLYEEHGFGEIDVSSVEASGDIGPSGDGGESGASKKPEDKAINEYLADSGASTKQDNALVIGWYLESVEGQDDFTPSEVKAKGDADKVPLGTRVKRDLNKNVQKGYLHSPGQRDGEDTYWVTEGGEEYLKQMGVPA